MKKQAFTLVELIVVITILAILATVGFVSFSWYLSWARDTNRIAQLKSMSDALELYRTKKDLPIPDDKVDVQSNGTTIAYQGYIWANVLETIEYTEKWLDPKDKNYFSYYLTKDKKQYQLLSFLEEPSENVLAFNDVLAVDYSQRANHLQWKKLWILTDINNSPIQSIDSITSSWYLDIALTNDTYNANITDTSIITGTWRVLSFMKAAMDSDGKSFACKEILESWVNYWDWIYTIFSWNESFEVLCDMTSNWWWWTLIDGVSDRFWQSVPTTLDVNPNIDNYSMNTDNLYSILQNIEHPTFKYKIERNWWWIDNNLELNIQVDDVEWYLKAYKWNLTDWEEVESTSWVTMDWWTQIQTKITNDFTRVTLRQVSETWNYGHLKSYSQQWPHSWWIGKDWLLSFFYLNTALLNITISELPTFWWLFSWWVYWWNTNSYMLMSSWETYWTRWDIVSNFPTLLDKDIKAGLWVK